MPNSPQWRISQETWEAFMFAVKKQKQKEKQELAVFGSLKVVKDWLSNRLINSSGPRKTQGSRFSRRGHDSSAVGI